MLTWMNTPYLVEDFMVFPGAVSSSSERREGPCNALLVHLLNLRCRREGPLGHWSVGEVPSDLLPSLPSAQLSMDGFFHLQNEEVPADVL